VARNDKEKYKAATVIEKVFVETFLADEKIQIKHLEASFEKFIAMILNE